MMLLLALLDLYGLVKVKTMTQNGSMGNVPGEM